MKKSVADITHLLKEWHPTKNGDFEPKGVSFSSHKRIWWQCQVNPIHVWDATANQRTNSQTGCPYCRNKRVDETNSLQTTHPNFAKDWHPSKNGKLTPNDVTAGSAKRIWWQCSNNPDHEWDAVVSSRIGNNSGCPHCSGASTSQPEIRILCELKHLNR